MKSYKTIYSITKNKANTSRFYKKIKLFLFKKQPHVPSEFSANFEISNKVIQADLGIFTHISANSGIFRNYSGTLRHFSDPV